MSNLVKETLLIEMQYLPSIAWMKAFMKYDEVFIDRHEHYQKGTYRNRCHILGPNGLQRLSIPLAHGKHQHKKIGEVLISYEQHWQKIHWMTLCSCYRRSAYFEFFEDSFYPFYHKHYETLFEFNLELLNQVFKILKIKKEIRFTEEYIGESDFRDMRSAILPNKEPEFTNKSEPYTQVFSDRFDFVPDLSIIDFIFNTGNKSAL